VWSVCYSPDGTKVVSGSRDKRVRIWDTTTGAVLSHFQGHSGDVNAVSYSPDGTKVVSGSDDKTVRIWATTAGNNDDRGTAALKGPAAKISPNLSGSFGSLGHTLWSTRKRKKYIFFVFGKEIFILWCTRKRKKSIFIFGFPKKKYFFRESSENFGNPNFIVRYDFVHTQKRKIFPDVIASVQNCNGRAENEFFSFSVS
jgi:WD40 repeat protein